MSSLLHSPLRRLFLVLLATVTVLPFATGSAHAAPAPAKAFVTGSDSDVQVRIPTGTLAVEDGFLVIRNNAGKRIDAFRLSYIGTDDRTYPIDARVEGRTATLVPSVNAARSVRTPADVLKSTARTTVANNTSGSGSSGSSLGSSDWGGSSDFGSSDKRDDKACQTQTQTQRRQAATALLSSELGWASTLGATIGGAIGMIIGILGTGVLALISVPIGVLVGVGIAVGIVALTGGFNRYFKVMNGKDC